MFDRARLLPRPFVLRRTSLGDDRDPGSAANLKTTAALETAAETFPVLAPATQFAELWHQFALKYGSSADGRTEADFHYLTPRSVQILDPNRWRVAHSVLHHKNETTGQDMDIPYDTFYYLAREGERFGDIAYSCFPAGYSGHLPLEELYQAQDAMFRVQNPWRVQFWEDSSLPEGFPLVMLPVLVKGAIDNGLLTLFPTPWSKPPTPTTPTKRVASAAEIAQYKKEQADKAAAAKRRQLMLYAGAGLAGLVALWGLSSALKKH